MAHPHDANVNLVSTDVIDSGFPFAALGPDIASMLAQAQFGVQGRQGVADTQARASVFGSQSSAAAQLGAAGIAGQARLGAAGISAQGQVGAAGISAQGNVDAQLIATNGAIAQNNAQMKTDAALAAAGDIAAYRRLLQEQQYDAQLQNNANKMQIAKLAGSGSLFDNVAARYAAAGQGGLPQIGGAFGLAGGIQQISAPTGNAPTSIADLLSYIPQAEFIQGGPSLIDAAQNFNFNTPDINFGNFSLPGAPTFGSGTELGSIGDLFGSINQSVFDSIAATHGDLITAVDGGGGGAGSGQNQTASAFTSGITGDPVASAANTDAANAFLLANQDQFLHAGGEIKKGESAIVGDDRGRLTPFSELIKVTDRGVKVTPIGNRTQFGNIRRLHEGTGPHDHDSIGIPAGETATVEPTTTNPLTTTPTTSNRPEGLLSDFDRLPALQALRGNPTQSIFSFGGPDFFSRPELGIGNNPSPFAFGKNFLTLPQDQKTDVLDFYKSFFGLQPGVTQNLFNQSQPGFRNFPQRQAFGF